MLSHVEVKVPGTHTVYDPERQTLAFSKLTLLLFESNRSQAQQEGQVGLKTFTEGK